MRRNPQPAIGDLRHRVAIEHVVRTGDGAGGAQERWAVLGLVWASVEPTRGDEELRADALSGDVSHVVTIRYRDDVLPAMRFTFDGRELEILSAFDAGERGRWLRCLCREQDL
ncbi:MAG: phage head closure protein [Pseudomonadota bacterium]